MCPRDETSWNVNGVTAAHISKAFLISFLTTFLAKSRPDKYKHVAFMQNKNEEI